MTTTTNIKLSTPAHGSNVDTWSEDPINNNSAIIDAIAGSVTSKALTNADVTLSATEAQAAVLRFSGILTGNCTINVGAIIKTWTIDNQTTGAFVVTISGGSGNVVGVPQGKTTQVVWDGTNCLFVNLGIDIGDYWDSARAAVPAWVTACTVPPFLLCDGSTFSAVTYPYLNTALGGNTLPDARGRSRFALNGGTSRVTTAGSGIDGDTRFAAGGDQNVTLLAANVPPVPVTIPAGQGSHNHIFANGNPNALTALVAAGQGAAGANFGTSGIANATLPAMTGTANNGVSASPTVVMPPAFIGGITMIRAA